MSKELSRSEIRKEADAHIELGMLLRKPRGDENKKIVEGLLHSGNPIWDIIREIKRLDRQAEEKPKSSEEAPAAKSEKDESPSITQQPLRYSLSVIRTVIKMPFKPNSYLVYLFTELKKVRAFGHRTHIFDSVFFPPNVRLREGLKRFFTTELVSNASALSKLVDQALEMGWYYLEKREYNLLVGLNELCRRLIALKYQGLDFRDRSLIEKLRIVESFYYVLHYRQSYPEAIVSSLHKVLDRDPRYQGKKEEISDAARRIIYPDVMLPSFLNFLLGLNMLRYRRFLTLSDLLCRDLGDIVNAKDFGCTGGVRKRITDFIQESKEQLVQLIEQRKEVEHLNDYLPVTKSGELDFGLLRRFYEGSAIANARYDYGADQENVMVFIPRFFRAFESILFPVLCGRILLTGGSKVRIFDRSFFPVEFPKIRQISTKLDKQAFNYRNFTKKRYFQIKDGDKGGIAIELEIINMIDEALSIITQMGKKIEMLIKGHHTAGESESSNEPLGTIVLQGKPCRVPHHGSQIRSRTLLNEKTVLDSLSFAVSVCFTLAAYFQDLDKLDVPSNLEHLDLKIRSALDVLERIADAVTFQELEGLIVKSLR